jgi:uncharacterized protein
VSITIVCASLLALFYIYLSLRIIGIRQKVKVALGDGGSSELQRAIRAHANFSEYVPLTLLLLFFLESQGGHALVQQLLCLLFLVARLVHAYGVSQTSENLRFRVFGMFSTMFVIVTSAIYLLLIAAGVA